MKMKLFFSVIIYFMFFIPTFSQGVTLIEDEKFKVFLNEKRKLNSTILSNNFFKVQIYNGDAATSNFFLNELNTNNKGYEGTIIFFAPIYKVWVGNYKTRIEAERNLVILKKLYPKSTLIRPSM